MGDEKRKDAAGIQAAIDAGYNLGEKHGAVRTIADRYRPFTMTRAITKSQDGTVNKGRASAGAARRFFAWSGRTRSSGP